MQLITGFGLILPLQILTVQVLDEFQQGLVELGQVGAELTGDLGPVFPGLMAALGNRGQAKFGLVWFGEQRVVSGGGFLEKGDCGVPALPSDDVHVVLGDEDGRDPAVRADGDSKL